MGATLKNGRTDTKGADGKAERHASCRCAEYQSGSAEVAALHWLRAAIWPFRPTQCGSL